MNEILTEIAKQSGIVAILFTIIWWLKNQLEKKEREEKEKQKEYIELLEKNHLLEKSFIDGYTKVGEIIKEISVDNNIDTRELKQLIIALIDNIKEIKTIISK